MTSVEKKVRETVADLAALDVNVVSLEATLASLDCDDDLQKIAEVIETEFGLDPIDESVAEAWRTVGDICLFVEQHV